MLVLTCNKGRFFKIGDDIKVEILNIKGDQVRIGIAAPNDLIILRDKHLIDDHKPLPDRGMTNASTKEKG